MTIPDFLKKYLFFIAPFLALSVFLGFFTAYQSNQYKVKLSLTDKLNGIFPLAYSIYSYTSSIHLTGLFMELRNAGDDFPVAIQILNKELVRNAEIYSELDSLIVKTAAFRNFAENNLIGEVKISASKFVEILDNHNHLVVDYLDIKKKYVELIIKDYEFSLTNGVRRFSSPDFETITEIEKNLRDSSERLSAVYKQYISVAQELTAKAGLGAPETRKR